MSKETYTSTLHVTRPDRMITKSTFCDPLRTGGADWNRTSDPLLAKQVLSQLSYSPILAGKSLFLMSCAWRSENQDSDGGPG
jgi:hypothetical protein